ncbi:MAG: phosphatase PAP2 family protein [Saprospirales bacterium]|nr:phosphatase PAP2 family protein [Saprospirales bacterium]
MRFLWIALCLSYTLALSGQPYTLDWKRESWIGGVGLTILAVDIGLHQSMQPLSVADIAQLDARDVFWPDRSAIDNNSAAANRRSNIAQWSSFVMAGMVSGGLVGQSYRQESKAAFFHEGFIVGVMLAETNLLALDGTYLMKGSVRRPRPYVYNAQVSIDRKTTTEARRSFFSGHTSLAAANTFFAASVFSGYFPESRWKPLVWGVAIALPAWTGVERVLAGKHFPTDVLAGYAFGAFTGWLVPRLHRQQGNLDVRPFSGGESIGLEMSLVF